MAQARITDVLSLRRTTCAKQSEKEIKVSITPVNGSETDRKKQHGTCTDPKQRKARGILGEDERVEDEEDGYEDAYKTSLDELTRVGLKGEERVKQEEEGLLMDMESTLTQLNEWQAAREIEIERLRSVKEQELEALTALMREEGKHEETDILLMHVQRRNESAKPRREPHTARVEGKEGNEAMKDTYETLKERVALLLAKEDQDKHELEDAKQRRQALAFETNCEIVSCLSDLDAGSLEGFDGIAELEEQLHSYTDALDALLGPE